MKNLGIGRLLISVMAACTVTGIMAPQAHAVNQVSTAACEREGGFVMKNSAGKWCKLGNFNGWGIYDVKSGGDAPNPNKGAADGPKGKSGISSVHEDVDSAPLNKR